MSRTDAENKFLAELARALENEDAYLERSRRFARWTSGAAAVLATLAFLIAFAVSENWLWIGAAAVIGFSTGALFGLGFHTRQGLLQWGVLRRFLDRDAIIKAHRDHR